MKIFNNENGSEKVYVQLNDLAYLMHYGDCVPVSIMKNVFSAPFIVTDDNRFNFMEFNEEDVIKFMKDADWIPDYKQYRKLTEKEIIDCGQEIATEMNNVAHEYNKTKKGNEKRRQMLADRHELLNFKMHSIAEILFVKQGHKTMPFPVVPDSDGFTLDRDDSEYIVSQGINPMQYLLYRKDGEAFDTDKDTNIPEGLIMSADSLCIASNTDSNEFFGDFKLKRDLTLDKKYLVTTFTMINIDKEKTNEDKMTLGKRIRDKFSKAFKKKD